MYVCGDCGAVFDTPQDSTETHGLDSPPYEELQVCPVCYGVCFAETFRCDGCDEYITGEYISTESGERFCDQCYTQRDLF